MLTIPTTFVRWTTDDLESFDSDRGYRYEIIDGELFVTRAPRWKHQTTCANVAAVLKRWCVESGRGEVAVGPGIVFSIFDSAIPDLAWASHETLTRGLDDRDRLTVAPELVVEVLSPGTSNKKRDREIKLNLYSTRGVREYWICDWQTKTVEVYRQENAALKLAATLSESEELDSPWLPGFSCAIAEFFS